MVFPLIMHHANVKCVLKQLPSLILLDPMGSNIPRVNKAAETFPSFTSFTVGASKVGKIQGHAIGLGYEI